MVQCISHVKILSVKHYFAIHTIIMMKCVFECRYPAIQKKATKIHLICQIKRRQQRFLQMKNKNSRFSPIPTAWRHPVHNWWHVLVCPYSSSRQSGNGYQPLFSIVYSATQPPQSVIRKIPTLPHTPTPSSKSVRSLYKESRAVFYINVDKVVFRHLKIPPWGKLIPTRGTTFKNMFQFYHT